MLVINSPNIANKVAIDFATKFFSFSTAVCHFRIDALPILSQSFGQIIRRALPLFMQRFSIPPNIPNDPVNNSV